MSILKSLPKYIRNQKLPETVIDDRLFSLWLCTWPMSLALEMRINQNRNQYHRRLSQEIHNGIMDRGNG